MAMQFPGTFAPANPDSFGIANADEISGHRSVKTLADLYKISDAILSKSKKNQDDDAIGQVWFVRDQNKHYKLINWVNRKRSSGWEVFLQVSGGGVDKEEFAQDGGFSQISGTRPIVDGVVEGEVEVSSTSVSLSSSAGEGEGVFWITKKGIFAYKSKGKYYNNWVGDTQREARYYKNDSDNLPKQNIFLYKDSNYTVELKSEFDLSSGQMKVTRSFTAFEFKTNGGGSNVTVVQTTGTSKTAVMSQEAVTNELKKKIDASKIATINGKPLTNGGNIEINLSKEPVDKGTLTSKDDIVNLVQEPYGVYSGVVDDSPILLGDFPGIKNVSIPAHDAVIVEVIDGSILAATTERTTVLNLQVIPSSSNSDGFTATMTSVNGKWENTRCSLALNNMASTLTFNQPMPTVSITGSWTFQNNTGSTVQASQISPQPDTRNPVLEYGYKAQFSGTYKWVSSKNTKAPQSVAEDSSFRDIPVDSTNSSVYTSAAVTETTTVKASVTAPKTGLMVKDGNIAPATGNDVASASVRVVFKHRKYYGNATTNVVSESMIKGLAKNELTDTRGGTIENINVPNKSYFVYAYPAICGDLKSVSQNGFGVLGGFKKSTVTITNAAGKQILYNVYVSEFDGAFKGETLIFS